MNDPAQSVSAYRWIVAWLVMIAVFAFITKFKAGYTIMYYLAVLVLVLLLLTQYQAIASLLLPFRLGQQREDVGPPVDPGPEKAPPTPGQGG